MITTNMAAFSHVSWQMVVCAVLFDIMKTLTRFNTHRRIRRTWHIVGFVAVGG